MFYMAALTTQLLNLDPPEKVLVREPDHHWPAPRNLQHQTRLRPDQVLELVRRYLAGMPALELAEEFEVSPTTVFAHLKQQDIPRHTYRKLHGELLDRATRLYLEEGLSMRRIAIELGINQGTVRSGLLRAGIKLRDRQA
jgi:DNA-directed RNA polymerase specialized sigma24 family protein